MGRTARAPVGKTGIGCLLPNSLSGRNVEIPLFLGISFFLHLLFILLVPAPTPEPPSARRIQVQPWAVIDHLRPFIPPRFDTPVPRLERLGAPDLSELPELARYLNLSHYPEIPGVPIPRLATPHPIDLATQKPRFHTPRVIMPDLARMAFEAARAHAGEYERYARLHLPDSDITDADSEGRDRARQIVERAIQAMGGRDALIAIRELRAKIWVQSDQHIMPDGSVVSVPAYTYPVAYWHANARGGFVSRPIQVRLSLDFAHPNSEYALWDPPRRGDFGWRWWSTFDLSGPCSSYGRPRSGRLRREGEAARWHFLDRFLGRGVVLDYIKAEAFGDEPVETVRVDDHLYGFYSEAMFSRRTGLLVALREGLTPAEEKWYRQLPGVCRERDPPVWTTVFHRYQEVGGVLCPHVLERWKNDGLHMVVQLEAAHNGAEPDGFAPALWDGRWTFAPLVH